MMIGVSIAFILGGATIPVTGQAENTFYLVGVTESAVFVIDRSTIRNEGGNPTALLLTAMAEPELVFGKPYQQAEIFVEFDCVGHRSRAKRFIARTMDGDYVGEDSRPDQWTSTGGSMRAAEDLVCRGTLPPARPANSFAVWRRVFLGYLDDRNGSG